MKNTRITEKIWHWRVLNQENHIMRVNTVFDVHAFWPDEAIIIGGVRPYEEKLAAHSDGDVDRCSAATPRDISNYSRIPVRHLRCRCREYYAKLAS